jgi:NAD(P)-dependent dehydrogenase (short-subunit alcohol dehydrogenase family)
MNQTALAGKVAIITGAGGGMGSVMTLALLAQGSRVAAVDANPGALEALATKAVKAAGSDRVLPIIGDVGKPEECQRIVRRATEAFGRITMLVNNAGIGMQTIRPDYMSNPVRFWEVDIDRFQRMMDINWKGPFLLARAVAPQMIAQKWGRIVNVTTSLDTMYRQNYTPYGMAKAALEAATSSWAKELHGTGVTANVLVPGGPVNTGFIPANAPMNRATMVQPEVMAAPICWLASDDSNEVTDCRFVGRDWDPKLPAAEASQKSRGPAAWPGIGAKAHWGGAS